MHIHRVHKSYMHIHMEDCVCDTERDHFSYQEKVQYCAGNNYKYSPT